MTVSRITASQHEFWPDGARLAVSVSMQFEAGGQPISGASGPITEPILDGFPDLGQNTFYEYGAREGVPRILDLLDQHQIKMTSFMIGDAVRRHPQVAAEIVRRGHEAGAHGRRWQRQYHLPRPQETGWIADSVQAIEQASSRRDKERLFTAAVALLDPHARRALEEINTDLLLGTGEVTATGVRCRGNGLDAIWALSWPQQQAAAIKPIIIRAYYGVGAHHPHLQAGTAGDWPLNVFDEKQAAAELPTLRAAASADLHNLVFQRDYREIAPELADLVDKKVIRILDAVVVTKDTSGGVSAVEFDELKDQPGFLEIDAEVGGLIGPDDISFVGAELDPGATAALLLLEDLWAAPLADALDRSGGMLLEGARIPRDLVDAAIAGLPASS